MESVAERRAEDARAVELVRIGDRATMTAVMQQHNHALWRIARGILSNESEAEDAVQDAYVSAFTHLDDFRGESTLYTWLARITINEALRRLRHRRPAIDLAGLAETMPVDHPHSLAPAASANPEHVAARREIARLVEQAIDTLNPAFRVVFVMRVIEQMSIDETSVRLGIPPETVKTRLHRANRQLRNILGAQFADAFSGIFPFAGARCERLQQAVLARLSFPARHPPAAI
jgi:RNA polymerase sigma-70 factor (ECF subfamily)